jgi:hypothetical protein
MNHKQYRELLHLSFASELGDEEQQVLARHLETCGSCQGEREELERLHGLVALRGSSVEPSDELLEEARRELRVSLRLERSRRSLWDRALEWIDAASSPAVRVAVAGAAMLFVGMGVSYMLFVPSGTANRTNDAPSLAAVASERGETRVSNLHFISQDLENQQVEFTFEMVTPVHVRGSANDLAVQKVLVQALLNDRNPGARLKTVSTLASQVEQTKLPDKEIKTALIQALKSDVNIGVRKAALTTLQKLPLDQDIKEAFLFVLKHETNPAMRIEVINYLEKPVLDGEWTGKDILDVLRESMQSDDNNYIRNRARNVLQEVKQ